MNGKGNILIIVSFIIVAIVVGGVIFNYLKGNQPSKEDIVDIAVENFEQSRNNVKSDIRERTVINPNDITAEMLKVVVNRIEEANISEQELHNYILWSLLLAEVYNYDVSIEEAVSKAKEKYDYDKAWLEVAKSHYEIEYTDEEVDQAIADGPDAHEVPSMQLMADALGMSLYEMNYIYIRKIHIMGVIWEKLQPKVIEKYRDYIKEYDPQSIVFFLYEAEVKAYMESEK
jgi:hypothetical protein